MVAAGLVLAVLLFPYAEALVMKGSLVRKLEKAKASRGRLGVIDRELTFLQFVKANQPPYVDALYLIAAGAPEGTRLESVSMNARGEVSLRGSLRDSQQVLQLRSKLIDSGFFSSVSVEEQNPTPDRQKVNVRMSAQWKPVIERQLVKLGPTPEEVEKIKTAAKQLSPGGMPGGMGMPGMPPGMPPMMMPPPGAMPAGLPPGIQLPPEILKQLGPNVQIKFQ
jgi:hypothetical protein